MASSLSLPKPYFLIIFDCDGVLVGQQVPRLKSVADANALKASLEEKSKEFVKQGGDVYVAP